MIQRYATVVNQAAVGLPVSVFINVTLENQIRENLEIFEEAVKEYPEVMECYLMAAIKLSPKTDPIHFE